MVYIMRIHLVLYSNSEPLNKINKRTIDSIYNCTQHKIIIHDFNLEKIKQKENKSQNTTISINHFFDLVINSISYLNFFFVKLKQVFFSYLASCAMCCWYVFVFFYYFLYFLHTSQLFEIDHITISFSLSLSFFFVFFQYFSVSV